jgi:hypothetical protein
MVGINTIIHTQNFVVPRDEIESSFDSLSNSSEEMRSEARDRYILSGYLKNRVKFLKRIN